MIKKIKTFLTSSVFQVASLSLLSTILVRLLYLVSIPVFSNLLNTAEYGNVETFVSYANIFMIVLGLDTQGAVAKAKLDFREDPKAYMSTNLIFTACFACVVALIVNLLYAVLQGVIGLTRLETNLMLVYGYALYVIAFRTAENNFDYQYKKNILMSGAASLSALAVSVVLVLTVFNDDRQSGRIIGLTVPTALCALIVYLFTCRRGKWRFNGKQLRYALKFGVPLIPHSLSQIILSSADRIMIRNMISPSDAGIYSLSYTLGMLLTVISEGMNQVFCPWLFRMIDKGRIDEVTKAQRLYLMAYVMIAVAVMTVSPEIVKLFGPEEYWDGRRIVMWVVYAVFLNFTYTLYVNVEFYYLKSNWISTGTIAAAVINCGLNLFFLKRYGYVFGAYSTVISYATLLVFHMIIVNCVLKKRYADDRFVVAVALVMLGFTFGMNLLLENVLLRFALGAAGLAAVAALALYIYKKYGRIDLSALKQEEGQV